MLIKNNILYKIGGASCCLLHTIIYLSGHKKSFVFVLSLDIPIKLVSGSYIRFLCIHNLQLFESLSCNSQLRMELSFKTVRFQAVEQFSLSMSHIFVYFNKLLQFLYSDAQKIILLMNVVVLPVSCARNSTNCSCRCCFVVVAHTTRSQQQQKFPAAGNIISAFSQRQAATKFVVVIINFNVRVACPCLSSVAQRDAHPKVAALERNLQHATCNCISGCCCCWQWRVMRRDIETMPGPGRQPDVLPAVVAAPFPPFSLLHHATRHTPHAPRPTPHSSRCLK